MRRQLLPALMMVVVFTILTGLFYPFVVTGVAQAAFKDKADGSLIERDGADRGLPLDRPAVHRAGLLPSPSFRDRLHARSWLRLWVKRGADQ